MSHPNRPALVLFLTALVVSFVAGPAAARGSSSKLPGKTIIPMATSKPAKPVYWTPVMPTDPVSFPAEEEEEEELFAYDLFEHELDGLDLVNSHLLAAASFYVYEPAGFEGDDFEGHLEDTMEGFGLELVHWVDHAPTDTQGAVFANDRVVILSYRGTTPGQDFWTDLSTALIPAPEGWGDHALVHAGFLGAFESVIDEIEPHVLAEIEDGKRLWITGHSLGGALATLSAMHFAANDTPVEAVHTWGSPRVGDGFFQSAYAQQGLSDRSWRWIMEGDPIPAFVESGPHLSCTFIFCSYSTVTYRHVGIPNNIFRSGNAPDFDYELEEEALVPIQASLCDGLLCLGSLHGALVEHVKYDDALDRFVEDEPLTDDELDALPPVQVDPGS